MEDCAKEQNMEPVRLPGGRVVLCPIGVEAWLGPHILGVW